MTCCIYGTCMIGIQTSPEPTKHATARVSQNPKQSISKTDLYPDTEAVCMRVPSFQESMQDAASRQSDFMQ